MSEKKQMITVRSRGLTKEFEAGTSYLDIAEAFQDTVPMRILLVRQNGNRYFELRKRITEDADLEFITYKDMEGYNTYRRSLCFLMLKSIENVYPGENIHVWIRFAVSGGLFCTMNKEVTEELLCKVKAEMEKLRDSACPIVKQNMDTAQVVRYFRENDMPDKAKLFRYRLSSRTNLYSLGGFYDYYYGNMVLDTSYLTLFDLRAYEDGFVLMCPSRDDTEELPEFNPLKKLFYVQNRSRHWGELMEVDTLGDLNDLVAAGRTQQLILTQEALHEKQMADIAQQIAGTPEKRLVMIAGPSSSGKTTFSHRLTTELSVHGLRPHPIPMDNYFKNREDTPRHEDGSYDFECLEALDVELFNENMTDLLSGKEVELPVFNFKAGKREYKGNRKKLDPRDILVIEGIHGMNDKLSYALPRESKFKIYISALTQLNIDEHNRIPTTDGRLLRRIVRDQRTRGTKAQETIAMWPSVRSGEENYIFPYQESADVMFNSALIYELAVLKSYAEPMLSAVPTDSREWPEAKRLLKFLDFFLPIVADSIPVNSLIREFIGGSVYKI